MMELEDLPEGASEEDIKKRGMYAKYDVIKRETGELVTEPVFVLKPDSDPIARRVMALYAELARQEGYGALATDIEDWMMKLRRPEFEAQRRALADEKENIEADQKARMEEGINSRTIREPEPAPIIEAHVGYEHGAEAICIHCETRIDFYSQGDQQFWKHEQAPEDGHVPEPN